MSARSSEAANMKHDDEDRPIAARSFGESCVTNARIYQSAVDRVIGMPLPNIVLDRLARRFGKGPISSEHF
jgi:hypothetical protein